MKRFLTSVVAITLILTMFISPCTAESSSGSLKIDSRLLTNVELSASKWYESEETRALFCAAAAMEVVLLEKTEYSDALLAALSSGCCYIAKSGLTLSAYFYSKDRIVLVVYQPLTDDLEAGLLNMSALSFADTMMSSLKTNGDITSYYEVDTGDVVTMIQLVIENAG